MSDSYLIRKHGNTSRSWYYIKDASDPGLECVVDYFNMFLDEDISKAKYLNSRILNGEIVGIRVDGYAIFVHPSNQSIISKCITIDQSLLPVIEEMTSFFFKEVVQKEPYRFYDSIADANDLIPEKPVISTERLETSDKHFLTVRKPERIVVDNLRYKFDYSPDKITGGPLYINAVNSNGLLLCAKVHRYYNDNLIDRRRLKRLIKRYEVGKSLIAKVDGYQVILVAKRWVKSKISYEDVLVILNQMADYYMKDYMKPSLDKYHFKDISEEDYQATYAERDKKNAKDNRRTIIITGLIMTVILALVISGWFISIFGVILFFAYLDDMLARR